MFRYGFKRVILNCFKIYNNEGFRFNSFIWDNKVLNSVNQVQHIIYHKLFKRIDANKLYFMNYNFNETSDTCEVDVQFMSDITSNTARGRMIFDSKNLIKKKEVCSFTILDS